MKCSLLLGAVTALLSIDRSVAFSLLQPSCTTVGTNNRRTISFRTGTLIKSSKEDEIASLEEKLRKLKEETQEESEDEQITSEVELIEEPLEALLSESWKDSEATEDQGGVVKNIIGTGIFLLACIAFSQVPVGNESLDKYSTAKPNQSIDFG
jgi:hypothetical protein